MNLSNFLRVSVTVILFILLIYLGSKYISWDEFCSLLYQSRYAFLMGFVIFLGRTIFAAKRYCLLLKALKSKKLKVSESVMLYIQSNFYSYFLPSSIAGDFFRIQKTSQLIDERKRDLALVVIVERLLGVLFIVSSTMLIFLLYPSYFLQLANRITADNMVISILMGVIAVLVVCVLVFKIGRKVYSYLKANFLMLVAGYGWSAAFYFFGFFAIWVALLPLPGMPSFTMLWIVLSTGFVVSVLPITVSGLAVREGTIAGSLMLYGFSLHVAVMVAMVVFFYLTLQALAGGVLLLYNSFSNVDH